MTTYIPPQKNVEYIFYVGLVSQADTKLLQNNPTLAAGDVLVSTDGGATSNLDTIPAVTPASSDMVKVTVSTTEMNGDNIIIVFSDAAGSEWCDLIINIQTSAQSLDAIDTVVDGIQTDLSNATDGLGALKALIDTIDGIVDDILTDTGTTLDALITTIDTVVDGIQTDLNNVTDGLGALKALIDTVDGVADSILTDTGTTLPATLTTISGYVDALETRLTAARAGYLDELAAANIPADVDTLKTYCDILDHATNGLANIKALIDAVDTVVDAIKAKTDNQPAGIQKNVAYNYCLFLMRLSSDHTTPATGKTIVAQVSKDGGAFVTCTNSVSEISAGIYKINLTQAEMNADSVILKFTETDCDTSFKELKPSV